MDKYEEQKQMMLKYGIDFYRLHWIDQELRIKEVDSKTCSI